MVPGTQAGSVLRPFDDAGLWGDFCVFAVAQVPRVSCGPQEEQCALTLRGSSASPASLSWVL